MMVRLCKRESLGKIRAGIERAVREENDPPAMVVEVVVND